MINISICICTRNREAGLLKILSSLEIIKIPDHVKIKIVIVENDIEKFSEDVVKSFSAKSKFEIEYFLEIRRGLAFARNRSVIESKGSDFCCFVDDDQVVDPLWLYELVKCQREFDSDGVYGCCLPSFNKEVPSYVMKAHQRTKYTYGTIIETAGTGGLLLRKKHLDLIDGPFDIRLNFVGGEDSFLTYLITNNGGIIRYTPYAIAYEIIPENRTTIKYIIRRIYRLSSSRLYRKSLINKKLTFYVLPKMFIRFFYGLLISVPFYFFGRANKLKGIIKIFDAIGGFAYFFGCKDEFYK